MNNRDESFNSQIRRHLIGMIKGMQINDLLPPERELAELFGTSRLTVHKVMAELQREGLVNRRKGKGTFVACSEGVVRNDLASPGAECVLVCYPNWFSYDIWNKVSLATQLGIQQGIEVFDYKLSPNICYEMLCEKVRERGGVRGIILIPPGGQLTRADAKVLSKAGVPVVSLVYSEYAAMTENISCVVKNHFMAGYLIIEKLLELGHSRLGYIANEPPSDDSDRFNKGMKSALRDMGVRQNCLLKCERELTIWSDSMSAGYGFTAELLIREKVSALIYDSVPGAMAGMSAISKAGLRIPQDISVIVNDQYGKFSEYTVPAVSVISYDMEAMMRRVFELIFQDDGNNRESLLFEVSLLERESLSQAPADTK